MAKQYPTASAGLFDAIGKILVWLVKQLARLLWRLIVIVVCHPRTTTALTVMATLVLHFGWIAVTTMAGVLLLSASIWKAAHGTSYERVIGRWVRTWWRRWWAYRRQWVKVVTRCELAVMVGEDAHLPTIREIYSTPYWDRLVVRGQIGQELKDFRDASERLRHAFKVKRAAVREISPLTFGLDFMRVDPLDEVVPATAIPASVEAVNFRAIPVGRDEFGDPFTLSLLGGTLCVSGSIGAGKAGVEWNILRGIAPATAAGLVRNVGIDPKLKELSQARPAIFAEGDYVTDAEGTVELLERLVADMQRDAKRDAAEGERDFEPRPGRPLTVVYVDEGAPLTRYWPRQLRGKIDDLLGLLLTQGRAVGYTVVFCIQEPTKDTFTLRDLFTRRLGMRLPTESHTDAALIEDAVEYGATCHQISESTPGILFALENGARSVVRARLGYVRNEDITELVEYVTSRRNVVNLDSRRPADAEAKAA